MDERVRRLVARTSNTGPVAGTAVANFLAFPPQEAPHGSMQAPFAAVLCLADDADAAIGTDVT
jgi:hypothetical protein